jgi:hypothetical protein
MVVSVPNEATVTLRKAMDELVQLNHGHQYTLDRDALIRLLDEALSRLAPP